MPGSGPGMTKSETWFLSIHFQRGDERFLRNVDLAELPHLLFAFLLLVEQLAFARGVAAVTFGGDVFAEGAHGLARDDFAADGGLDRHDEHVWRNQLLQLLRHGAAARFGARAMHQHGQRIDRKQSAEHHRDRRAKAGQGLVHRIALVGDGVADARIGDFLDRGGEHADLAWTEFVDRRELGLEYANAVDLIMRVDADHADAPAYFQHAVDHAHQHHHAEIDVVPGVHQQRLERRIAVAFGRR